MHRSQTVVLKLPPGIARDLELALVLILRALSELVRQRRPCRDVGVDQRIDGVVCDWPDDALRLTQRGPELRRVRIARQLEARALARGAAMLLIVEILAAASDHTMNMVRQINRLSRHFLLQQDTGRAPNRPLAAMRQLRL